jgi:hypothetical protein
MGSVTSPVTEVDAIPDETDAEMAARQHRMLTRLTEIGMNLAEAVEDEVLTAKADGAPLGRGEAARSFPRIARAVRLTMMLQARLRKDHRALETQRLADEAAALAKQTEARIDRRKHEVFKLLERAIDTQADKSCANTLWDDILERLCTEGEDADDYKFADLPTGELVAMICRDLDMAFDWSRFPDEDWAAEAADADAKYPPTAEAIARTRSPQPDPMRGAPPPDDPPPALHRPNGHSP